MTRAERQVKAVREWMDQMDKEAKAARESGTLSGASSAMVAETFMNELRARMDVSEEPRTNAQIIEDVLANPVATRDIVTYAVREGVRMRLLPRWTQERHEEVSTGLAELVDPLIRDIPETPADPFAEV